MTHALECTCRREQWSPRALGALANATGAYPLLLLGLLYGQWLLAWAVLGHPPRPSLDDPKSIAGVGWLHWATGVALVGWLPVLVGALGLNALHVARQRGSARLAAVRMGWVLGLWLASLMLLRLDPGSVVSWWMD